MDSTNVAGGPRDGNRRSRVDVPELLRSLAPADVALATGITVTQLRSLRQRGKGPAFIRVSARTIRYIGADVDRWRA